MSNTPEQKAKELIEKFKEPQIKGISNDAWQLKFEAKDEQVDRAAKSCAHICIDEIEKALLEHDVETTIPLSSVISKLHQIKQFITNQ